MEMMIVAEMGSCWNPEDSLASCMSLVEAAADAGADAIKMQDWAPIKEMNRDDEWKEQCAPWTIVPGTLREIKSYARWHKLEFLCSVFTMDAITRAVRLRYPAIKIASSEIRNLALLARMGRLNVPFWLSTGEAGKGYKVVERALDALNARDVTLLHCVAEYPAADANLGRMQKLAQRFPRCSVGWSSHVAYPAAVAVAAEAARQGATVIEAHLRMKGVTPKNAPDNGAWSLFPSELAEVAEAVRNV